MACSLPLEPCCPRWCPASTGFWTSDRCSGRARRWPRASLRIGAGMPAESGVASGLEVATELGRQGEQQVLLGRMNFLDVAVADARETIEDSSHEHLPDR